MVAQQSSLEIADETQQVLLAPSHPLADALGRPFFAQDGTILTGESIPRLVVARSDRALSLCLIPSLQPPSSQHRYIAYRKPSFEAEYMWLSWTAQGRRIRWSDLDPDSFLLVELLPGELTAADDAVFGLDLDAWLRAKLRIPTAAGELRRSLMRRAPLPSGHIWRMGTVTSPALESQLPRVPEPISWSAGFTYWTDGRVICLQFDFPTARSSERRLPSPHGDRQPGSRTRSRFDPPLP